MEEQIIKRLVAVSSAEYELAQVLSKGIGFSGYCADALREKMASDLKRRERLERAQALIVRRV